MSLHSAMIMLIVVCTFQASPVLTDTPVNCTEEVNYEGNGVVTGCDLGQGVLIFKGRALADPTATGRDFEPSKLDSSSGSNAPGLGAGPPKLLTELLESPRDEMLTQFSLSDELAIRNERSRRQNRIHWPNLKNYARKHILTKEWNGDPFVQFDLSAIGRESKIRAGEVRFTVPVPFLAGRLDRKLLPGLLIDAEGQLQQRYVDDELGRSGLFGTSYDLGTLESRLDFQRASTVATNTLAIEAAVAIRARTTLDSLARHGFLVKTADRGSSDPLLSAPAATARQMDALQRLGLHGPNLKDVEVARANVPTIAAINWTFVRLRLIESSFGERHAKKIFAVEAKTIGVEAVRLGYNALSIRDGVLAKSFAEIAELMLDVSLSVFPPTGLGRDVLEAVTGTNALTGLELTSLERGFAVLGCATLGFSSSTKPIRIALSRLIAAFRGEKAAVAVGQVTAGAILESSATVGRQSLLRKLVAADGEFRFSATVRRQLSDPRRYVPMRAILETVGSGHRFPDPQRAPGRFMFSAQASKLVETEAGSRWSNGLLEVLVDENSWVIEHIGYRRQP